jgi:hypothetical protein
MGRLFVADQKKDRETGNDDRTMQRVGYGTFPMALQLTFVSIEAGTGVNFSTMCGPPNHATIRPQRESRPLRELLVDLDAEDVLCTEGLGRAQRRPAAASCCCVIWVCVAATRFA